MRELELGVCTTEERLVDMLGRMAPSLRRLRLKGSMLLVEKGSWPGVFRRMRTVRWNLLEELDCWDLRDMDYGAMTESKYFARLGPEGCGSYDGNAYGRAVRDWVLERSDVEPEWDEGTFVRNHTAVCGECTSDAALQDVVEEVDCMAISEQAGLEASVGL